MLTERREQMSRKSAGWRAVAGVLLVLTSLGAQRPFREYPGREYTDFPLPPDYRDQAETPETRAVRASLGWAGGPRGYPGLPHLWHKNKTNLYRSPITLKDTLMSRNI